ncbi:hypothetical protein ACFWJQ_18445 [Streptomyces goshikiensis]|uniref:hypothetical protein n=1 Tax=Streptomyces goshikiensis TaxID=1942 RepID=UPI0036466B28
MADLIRRRGKENFDAAMMRRFAELLEVVGDQLAANHWWLKAADAGDEDARDYVDFLQEESGFIMSTPEEQEQVIYMKARHDLLAACTDREAAGRLCPSDVQISIDRYIEEIEEYLSNPDQVTDGRRL